MTTFKYLFVLLAALTSVACANMGGTAIGNDSTVTEAHLDIHALKSVFGIKLVI